MKMNKANKVMGKQAPPAKKQAPPAKKQVPPAKKQAPPAKKQAPAATKKGPVVPKIVSLNSIKDASAYLYNTILHTDHNFSYLQPHVGDSEEDESGINH